MNASAKREFGCRFVLATSMPSEKRGYIPGGAMQLIRGRVAGQYGKSGGDKYSRCTWMKLGGKNDNK